MRLSMANKIYAVVVLMVVITLVIVGMALYGIGALNKSMDYLGSLSRSAADLQTMDKLVLLRRALTTNIISSVDEPEMRGMIDKDMKKSDEDMEREIQSYQEDLPRPHTQEQSSNIETLRKYWSDYAGITRRIGELSYENANQKAYLMNEDMVDFWNKMDTDIENMAQFITQSNEQPIWSVYTPLSRLIRTSMMRYRLIIAKFIPETDPGRSDAYEKELADLVAGIGRDLERIQTNVPGANGGQQAADIIRRFRETGLTGYGKIMELGRQNSNVKANNLLNGDGRVARLRLDEFTNKIVDQAMNDMNNAIRHGQELGAWVDRLMIIVGAVGIVISVFLAYMVISRIIRRLNGIIAHLEDSSAHVNQAAGQISSSSQSLAEGSTAQAASLEETSSALEQMASMTRQNADNANKTNNTTQNNNKLIATGATAVKNMSQAMGEINDSAEQINRIIKTIEDIAFQTNLLALNAAVEAARAGEAGKGFAVVADEVRNLAGRSAQAARDTTQLIHTTIERVRHGSEIAGQLDSSFKEIESGSHSVARLIGEITSATNEQAQGVDQVNTAVAQMDKVTQSNAATAEEAASAAEELSGQATALKDMVGDLIGMVEGADEKAAGPVMPPRSGGGGAPGHGSQRVMQVRKLETASPAPRSGGGNSGGGKMKMLSASEVIPLDKSDDF